MINFNSQEHQNVLRIELSYPPNEKKGTKLKLTIDWQSMRRFEWDRKMERTVDCKNALFPRVENDGT